MARASANEPGASLVDAQLVAEYPRPTELHDLACDRLERLGSFGSRFSYNDRLARVPALTYCRDQGYLAKKRYTELLRELGPPPLPNISYLEPSGPLNQLMFSITPRSGRFILRAMYALRCATRLAAAWGVVTT